MIKLEMTTNLDINCSNEMQIVRNIAIEETYNIRVCLVWVLKFNKHCSTFVLFDKKFSILD
jgi:hypothetical protein